MEICDNCDREMVVRKSAKGEFWGCTGYPNCKNTKPLVGGESPLPVAPSQSVIESKHDVVIQRTEKPHSLEIGKPGNRHKIYYSDVTELQMHIKALKGADLYEEEISDLTAPQ